MGSACSIIGGLIGVPGWLLRFARLMLVPKAVLAAKLLAAESQLAACVDAIDRRKAPKPRCSAACTTAAFALPRSSRADSNLAATQGYDSISSNVHNARQDSFACAAAPG